MNTNKDKGFSLIELLIVMIVLSIIMGLAVPGYRQFVMRANRADATTALLRLQNAQERFYIQNGIYASNAQMAAAPPAGLGITSTERNYYNLAIQPAAGGLAVGYTATATVNGAEAQKDNTDCWVFSTTESGQRTALSNGGADMTDKCWR